MTQECTIQSFANRGTEDIYNNNNTQAARKTCPSFLWVAAYRKLEQLDTVNELDDIRFPPGNRLEALKDDRKGQHSIRINAKYRICFVWTDLGPTNVEIIDYH